MNNELSLFHLFNEIELLSVKFKYLKCILQLEINEISVADNDKNSQ